jgi:LuxR family maltose regulon positive regulatory protein
VKPGRPAAGDRPGDGEDLTERELAVLRLLPTSLSRREIADALYVSPNTVKTHAKGIYRKLDASSREDAVARARELGLL